ncbi:MAG: LEA type 2 family protein [Acidobacteriota bacterium]
MTLDRLPARTPVALATLLVLTTVSCASLQPDSLPEVSVINLRLSDMTLLESTAEFEVRIINPGHNPLSIDGGSFAISLGGLRVGRGVYDQALVVPRYGTATVKVPVYLNNIALATRLKPLLDSRQIDYAIDSTLFRPDLPLGLRKVRSHGKGTLDFNPSQRTGSSQER